jgi:hypothetical protein
MKARALLSFMACGISLLLCGCGVGSPKPVVPAISPLAGNWLLVGPMPTNGIIVIPSGPPLPSGVRLAMTFDVAGNQVIAGGFVNNFCGNGGVGFEFGDVAAGIVAADGSFTATPTNGSLNTSCPLVSGVYVGTGSTTVGTKTVPVTVQVTLQQGGLVTNPGNGAASHYFSNTVLTGSIKVQGSPCFSSGGTQATPASSVIGNVVSARFLMDDGSTLSLGGPLTDVTEGHISTGFAPIQGGSCGSPANFLFVDGLDRQS